MQSVLFFSLFFFWFIFSMDIPSSFPPLPVLCFSSSTRFSCFRYLFGYPSLSMVHNMLPAAPVAGWSAGCCTQMQKFTRMGLAVLIVSGPGA